MADTADIHRPGKAGAWLLAARPATLTAAIAPVMLGSAIAIGDGVFRVDLWVVITVAALAIQIGVNFANDVADAARGADNEDRIGPARAVASGLLTPREMWRGIGVVFGVAIVCGLYLAWVAGPVVLVIGALSLLAALGYTNGPIPYGYYGLGEVFVFIFFGPVATVGTRYVYDGTVTRQAWIGGIVMGLLAAAILVANNIRDLESDRAAGKRTIAVVIGRHATRALYSAVLATAFVIPSLAVAAGWFPTAALLMLVAIPLAVSPLRAIWVATAGPPLIEALKATARLQVAAALLLSGGFMI